MICDVLLIADGTDSKCTTASFELEYPPYNRLYILDYINTILINIIVELFYSQMEQTSFFFHSLMISALSVFERHSFKIHITKDFQRHSQNLY